MSTTSSASPATTAGKGKPAGVTKPKRRRRTAREIERPYKCTVANCNKGYGSEGALKMHIRLKHDDVYRSLNPKRDTQGDSSKRQMAYPYQPGMMPLAMPPRPHMGMYQPDPSMAGIPMPYGYPFYAMSAQPQAMYMPAPHTYAAPSFHYHPQAVMPQPSVSSHVESSYVGLDSHPETLAAATPDPIVTPLPPAVASIAMLQVGLWRRHDDSSESLQLVIDYGTSRFRYLSQFGDQHFEIQVPFQTIQNLKLESHASHLGITIAYMVSAQPQFAINGQPSEDFTGATDVFWKQHNVLFSKQCSFSALLGILRDAPELRDALEVVERNEHERYGKGMAELGEWDDIPEIGTEAELFSLPLGLGMEADSDHISPFVELYNTNSQQTTISDMPK